MNKKFLLVAAICVAMNLNGFAQENLAKGKNVYPNGAVIDGVNKDDFKNITNENDGDEVRLAPDNGKEDATAKVQDFYIDLGNADNEVGFIKAIWEGATPSKYTLYSGVKGENGDFTWSKLKDVEVAESMHTVSVFTKLDTPVKTQYIRCEAVGHNTQWGVKIREMYVYKNEDIRIASIKPNATDLKPGDEFSVEVDDQFGEKYTDKYELDVTNATPVEGKENTFKVTSEGDVVVKVKDTDVSINIYAYSPVLTTLTVNKSFVKMNEATSLTFSAKDQKGKKYSLDGAKYSSEDGTIEDGKFTTTKAGLNTIKATLGDNTATVTVYALSDNDAPVDGITENYTISGIYSNEDNTNNEKAGWNSQYKNADVIDGDLTLGGKTVKEVDNLRNILIGKLSADGKTTEELNFVNTDKYTDLKIALFPSKDTKANLRLEGEGDGVVTKTFDLKGNEWNYLSLSGFTEKTKIKWIDVETQDFYPNGDYPSFLVSNVYFQKLAEGALIIDEVNIENGVVKAEGTVSTENVSKLNDEAFKDVTVFDLSGATIANDVTKIEVKNPNALLVVDKVANVNAEKDFIVAKQLTGNTNNVVITDGQWYLACNSLKFDDRYAIPTSIAVNSGDKGYNYTRTLVKDTWATTCLPANATVPTGLKAYELSTENSDQIDLKEVTEMVAGVPYIVHATEDVDLTASGTDNYDVCSDAGVKAKIVNGSTAVFHGNIFATKGTGEEYGLGKSSYNKEANTLTLLKINESNTIGTFRAYFTKVDDSANAPVLRLPSETTGINTINANGAQKSMDIYSVDGRLVKKNATSLNGLDGGIYIVNGKKYVVK